MNQPTLFYISPSEVSTTRKATKKHHARSPQQESKKTKVQVNSNDDEFPVCKINPNSLVIYTPRKNFSNRKGFSFYDNDGNKIKETTNTQNRPNNKTNGFLSPKAGSRLRKCIKYLLWTSGVFKIQGKKINMRLLGKITFVTLTLSSDQLHSDIYIKEKMINQFITELNRKVINLRYIWRAEKQLNGNIHFHFLINRYVHYNWVQGTWNRIQDKEGYVQPYTEKFSQMSFKDYCLQDKKFRPDKIPLYKKRYQKGCDCGWTNPPSCQAKGLHDTKKAIYYISKYVTKNDIDIELLTDDQKEIVKNENRLNDIKPSDLPEATRKKLSIEGHIYFCSQILSSIVAPIENLDDNVQRDLIKLQSLVPDSFLYEQWYTIVKLSIEQIFNLGCYHLYNCFLDCLPVFADTNLFTPT